MATTMAHRGPDAEGVWIAPDAPVSLGHRRLSIIDLNPRGNQPMVYRYRDLELVLTFNGEIYNYRQLGRELEAKGYEFHTTSDSEVILAAYAEWGADAVKRFNGMWAFAIWHPAERTIFLSRDRFGKKPLYYFNPGDKLFFASEIKALLVAPQTPRRANRTVVADYLLRGLANHTPSSFFESISSLPAGHNATFQVDSGKLRVWPYYAPRVAERDVSDAELKGALQAAVELRTISDVPISISLSGGIDSSSIAALLAQVSTGTIAAFTTTSKTGPGDESTLVRKLLERYPQYQLHVRPLEEERFLRQFEAIVYHMEEPLWFDAPYVRWEIASAVHDEGFKVLLTGEGADEALGGYWLASSFHLRELFRGRHFVRLASELVGLLRQPERAHILRAFPTLALGDRWMAHRKSDALARKLGITLVATQQSVLAHVHDGTLKDYLRWALSTYILPQLLVCNDKMSMAHSVESRAPFLDVDFVETALAIQSIDLVRNGRRKYPLRRVMDGMVPDEILYRRQKDAFGSPMRSFLGSRQIQERFQRYFKDPVCAPLIDRNQVLEHQRSKGIDELLARLFWIECWSRVFDVSWS